jgi:cysteine desulfurase/selenocysteine lyase
MTKPSSDIVAEKSRPAAEPLGSPAALDVARIRSQFPILKLKVHRDKPLVYLDNAATTQKPQAVIDAITHYYTNENANIHRGVYWLSQVATDHYESVRTKVRKFLNAGDDREIIFTRGTTEAINLVAYSFSRAFLRAGDEILVSNLEHHSNIVPWQLAAERHRAAVRAIPINDQGELLPNEFARLLQSGRVKLVAVNHLSNSLGTINDVKAIARLAHDVGAKVLVDGAQWVAHYATDVRDLDADFYTFSGHKLYGPTGLGVLYGKRELLEAMPPFHGGGDMIETVRFERTTYADLPNKFEAGTPDIAGVIGLGAAIDWINSIGLDKIAAYEDELTQYLTEQIGMVGGIRIVGTAARKGGICSFVVEKPALAAHDVGVLLDLEGIAVRTGHHCCMPVMERLNVPATIRASLAIYNTKDDIDALVGALEKITASTLATPAAPPRETGELKWAPASAASPTDAANELADTFDFLGDRDARNQFILELGEKHPPLPDFVKIEANRVHGCMSTVHLVGRRKPGADGVIEFAAESDAHIVRGLIAILEKLFSGQRARDVLAFDVEGFFRRINLDQFISSQRRNGLAGMVKRIKSIATEIEAGR